MVGAVLFNPLPILFKPTRFWLLKNWFRLLTSGVHRVEVSYSQSFDRLHDAKYGSSLQISGWGTPRSVLPDAFILINDGHFSDQFCSLVFTISNFYFLGCAYSGGFDAHWVKCMTPARWGVPFVLASLPLLARLVQSIRRWADSKLVTHLINVSSTSTISIPAT